MRSKHSPKALWIVVHVKTFLISKKFQCRTKSAHPFVLPIGFLNARKLALG